MRAVTEIPQTDIIREELVFGFMGVFLNQITLFPKVSTLDLSLSFVKQHGQYRRVSAKVEIIFSL